VDEVGFFNAVLSSANIATIRKQGLAAVLGGMPEAADPTPALGATDVPRDSALGWTAGMFAATHDVYLGTSPTDVNSAGRNKPQGILVSQGQTDTRYSPQGPLEYGRTYYWRIDEVNKPSDNKVFKGMSGPSRSSRTRIRSGRQRPLPPVPRRAWDRRRPSMARA
jgi:hypothetical protein